MGESFVVWNAQRMAQAPWAEFLKDKHLLWIAKEWDSYSDQLADWAMARLVNRRDVWSQYTVSKGEVRVFMLPIPERRKLGTDMVTFDKLKRHFSGKQPGHLIGLHSISDHATAKWFAIDVDLHDEKAINAGELARANFNAALEWSLRLQADGFDPFLMDSNGVGGYHVWTLLDKGISTRRCLRLRKRTAVGLRRVWFTEKARDISSSSRGGKRFVAVHIAAAGPTPAASVL
jgi:hypothetical protein